MYNMRSQLFLKISLANSYPKAPRHQALLLQLLWQQIHRERKFKRASEVSLWAPQLSVRGLRLALYHQRAFGRSCPQAQQR